MTVLVCGNASGDQKLTPFLIDKYTNPRPLNNVNNLPVLYGVHPNAWLTDELFKNWVFQNFVPTVGQFSKTQATFGH